MNRLEQERLLAIAEIIDLQQYERAAKLIEKQLENPMNTWEYTFNLEQLQVKIAYLRRAGQPLNHQEIFDLLYSTSYEDQMIGIGKVTPDFIDVYQGEVETRLASLVGEFRGILLLKLKSIGVKQIRLEERIIDLDAMVDPYDDEIFLWGYQQLERQLMKEAGALDIAQIALTSEVLAYLPDQYNREAMEELLFNIVKELHPSLLSNGNLS